ncbi:MAG: hypothetical protein U0169_24480 [Polyangiaceae bacterium]
MKRSSKSTSVSLVLTASVLVGAALSQACWIGGALPPCAASSRLSDSARAFDDSRSLESSLHTVIDRALSGSVKGSLQGFVAPTTDDAALEASLKANPRTWFETPACLTVAVERTESFVRATTTFEGCRLPGVETVWNGNVLSTWTRDAGALVVDHSTLSFTRDGKTLVSHRNLRFATDGDKATLVSSVQTTQGDASEQDLADPYLVRWDVTSTLTAPEAACAQTLGSAKGRFRNLTGEARFEARWDDVRECATTDTVFRSYDGTATIVTGDEPREGALVVFSSESAGLLVSERGVDDESSTRSCSARY